MHTNTGKIAAVLASLLVLASAGSLASIENEPVKVTHKNSGPKYDVSMEVEKTLMGADNDQAANQVLPPRSLEPPSSSSGGDNNDNDSPVGHLSIRRIFLVPMKSREDIPQQPQTDSDSMEPSLLLRGSIWPMFAPAMPRPHHHHPHLFGQDEASRPPMGAGEEPILSSQSAPTEREQQQQPQGALLDPIQMIMDLMQQALNPMASMGNTFPTDLNREATSSKTNATNQNSSLDKPQLAPMGHHNDTKEEIVEIEGKKYLRRVVINRHVGDNLIFMTKRLIFTPLNETDSTTITTTTTTTTELPAVSGNGSVERETEPVSRKPDEEQVSSTTTTTTATPEVAKSEASSSVAEQTTTTTTASTQEASSPSNAPSTTPLDKDKEAAGALDVIRRAVNSS